MKGQIIFCKICYLPTRFARRGFQKNLAEKETNNFEVPTQTHFVVPCAYVNNANWIGGHQLLYSPFKMVSDEIGNDIAPLSTV